MIIRIAVSDPTATCPLNIKFGCDPVEKAVELLAKAAQMNVQVIGVSFHVGSGCNDPKAFELAIVYSRRLFDIGSQLGHDMRLLDLGGGYPGFDSPKINFNKIADVINNAIDRHFSDVAVDIVAEPGRFFASAPFSLVTNIIASTAVPASRITKNDADNDRDGRMYYVNDGVYGSFNCVLYDHTHPVGEPLFWRPDDDDDRRKTDALVWGPTCDGLDLIVEHCRLRPLHEGEWLYWPRMGAYTCAAGSEFNGFVRPGIHYIIDQEHWMKLYGNDRCEVSTDDEDKQSIATECSSNSISSDSDLF
jgi:ornithine decarboxylase